MNKQSASVAVICTVSFIQAYLLVNIFPYQAYMSVFLWNRQHTDKIITVEQAGPYAAFLTTSFMIGRTLTAHYWGKLADIYGRRVTLITSLIGSGCACIWFGMASAYGGAVLARGVIGAWNSIVGVTKTLATELAYYGFRNNVQIHNANSDLHKQETRIVGLVMSMRAWGFLIAPAIAGFVADPLMVRQSDDISKGISTDNLFMQLLQLYPYLLPNLLGALLCWLTAAGVYVIVPETLEDCKTLDYGMQCKIRLGFRSQHSYTKINGTYGSLEEMNNDSELNDDTGGCWQAEHDTTSIFSIWSRRNTRNHLIAYWLYSFVIIAIDEAFPLFCISRNNNGIGQLSETDIGTILSIAGLIFAVGQFHIYTWIVDRFGVYGSLTFGCWAGVLPISLIPCAALVAHFSNRLGVTMYVALLMGMTKIFQSAFFSGITVATNRTVPKEMRSSMNGFGGMGAGGAKAMGPLFVGYWMSMCLSWDGNDEITNGGIVAWLGLASLSLPIFFNLQALEHSDN
ncbi:hypothetical protein ACHAXN_013038 [Cyclotella atomus]